MIKSIRTDMHTHTIASGHAYSTLLENVNFEVIGFLVLFVHPVAIIDIIIIIINNLLDIFTYFPSLFYISIFLTSDKTKIKYIRY